jgi:hypothetical protein
VFKAALPIEHFARARKLINWVGSSIPFAAELPQRLLEDLAHLEVH